MIFIGFYWPIHCQKMWAALYWKMVPIYSRRGLWCPKRSMFHSPRSCFWSRFNSMWHGQIGTVWYKGLAWPGACDYTLPLLPPIEKRRIWLSVLLWHHLSLSRERSLFKKCNLPFAPPWWLSQIVTSLLHMPFQVVVCSLSHRKQIFCVCQWQIILLICKFKNLNPDAKTKGVCLKDITKDL